MDAQMKKGLLDACVLCVLENEEGYGYKIIEDLKHVVEISESTLYPILKRLEACEYLTVQNRECNGRLRKYYRMTHKGTLRLKELRTSLRSMKNMHNFILKGEIEL